MKVYKPEDKVNGIRAHWEFTCPTDMAILTALQYENQSKLKFRFSDQIGPEGVIETETFIYGDPPSDPITLIALILPVGEWKYETSSDGINWITQGERNSDGTGDRVINYTLAGQTPFPVRWTRYTKIMATKVS